jgi:phosphatidylserine/phosphatidylglycerophosphate/cardiolipin synthase-like enzyme
MPETVAVNRTRLLVAPDNAGGAVVAALDGADDSIDVLQMSIDGPDQRFLRATVRAARRGVVVRVLLSSAWYVEEENRRLVEHLRDTAEREDLPLAVKLAEPAGDFEKVHAKGVVIDGDEVLLGSLNWNGESIEQNREVVLSLEGAAVGEYYRDAFDADWEGRGGERSLPVGIVAGVAGCLLLAVLVARRIEFGERVGVRG